MLHGGGNTSLKSTEKNLFGESEEILYVKGSGWDLATIEAQGFAPVRMDVLLKMAKLEHLSDSDMVNGQKSAMTNPNAPNPSVEAILHAIIPFKFVDHTHSDAVVAVTNSPQGEQRIREIYGDKVLYIPYVMPGFVLARKVYELTRDADWSRYEGMVLLHHGIFSFGNSAKESYERMIRLVSRAEDYLKAKNAFEVPVARKSEASINRLALVHLRKQVSNVLGKPVVAVWNGSAEAVSFSELPRMKGFAARGPLTPDHVIHTKRIPLLLESGTDRQQISGAVDSFAKEYKKYFERNVGTQKLQCLDSAPRWAVWPGHGVVSFGVSAKQANVVGDIARHTMRAEQWAEALGAWTALPEKDIFEMEYWELEQAKLKKGGSAGALQGKVAIVTGAAGGIGRASVNSLRAQGAAVVALDINPEVKSLWKGPDVFGVECDVTSSAAVDKAVAQAVEKFGGIDIVVANAGMFPKSKTLDSLDDQGWDLSMQLNLTSQMYLFRACVPYLALGVNPAVVVVASKNVPAPGPGAAAYSAAKAGLTQLARVMALELGEKGVRVNILHPHAVMDTGIWTPEVLESRANHYKMTVEEYKRNNLLKVEVVSRDVGELVAAMAGPLFSKTTGAQVAVDGGSDRVI